MTDNLSHIALITGASRGIGEAIALRLGQEGVRIIGTATSEEGALAISQMFEKRGIKGQGKVLNVAVPESIDTLIETLKIAGIYPNILINNAGITRDGLLLRMKEDDWGSVIQTNLTSLYHLSQKVLKGMLKADHGRIINISSVVALSGNPGQTNYAAAKAGMIGFTRSLALELAPRGITVNAIAPGFIKTDMINTISAEKTKKILEKIPLKRFGKPEDIAAVAAFLSSDKAAYITGQTINVSGGLYIG